MQWRALLPVVLAAGCDLYFGHSHASHPRDAGGDGDPADGDAPSDAAADAPIDAPIIPCASDADCTLPHEFCDVAAGSSGTCACVAGYSWGGSSCTWIGVIADPGFQDAMEWVTDGTIDPTYTDQYITDPGVATLANYQHISQTVVMPRLSSSQLLVVQSVTGHPYGSEKSISVGLYGTWIDTFVEPNTSWAWVTDRTCLAADQYAPESSTGRGAATKLDIMAELPTFGVTIDHVEIVPAMPGECAVPGPIANGDAQGSGNWQFATQTPGGSDGTSAGYSSSAGQNGTRGVRLFIAASSDSATATATGAVASRTQLSHPAISYYARAPQSGTALLGFLGNWYDADGLQVVANWTIVPTASGSVFESCLPPTFTWRQLTLPFSLWCQPGQCTGTAADLEADIDNLALIDEPACGSNPYVTDPGFESGLTPFAASYTPGQGSVAVVADSASAHSGTHALRLSATCGYTDWLTGVVVPPNSAGGGPALEFYYKAPNTSAASFVAYPSLFGTIQPMTFDNTWRRGLVCFDPATSGRSVPIDFSINAQSSPCTTPEVDYWVDDLAAINDPSCPH